MIPKVVVLYDLPLLPCEHPDAESESDVLFTVQAVQDCLLDAGFDVALLPVGRDPDSMLASLRQSRPDVVFNLCEARVSHPQSETYAASMLEWLDLPFTGCPSTALRLGIDKPLAKRLLLGSGLPTAPFFTIDRLPVLSCPLPWPVIVKPGMEDGSSGLDHRSVVTSQEQLTEQAAYLLRQYGPPVLVEEFLEGRELKVALMDLPRRQTFVISEIQHLPQSPECWPILTYAGKRKPDSPDDLATPTRFVDEETPLCAELTRLAWEAFRLFGCRDYASIDFRLNKAGQPYILEVNPNPDFNPGAGFAAALGKTGLSYLQFVVNLVKAALRRGRRTQPQPAALKTRRVRQTKRVPTQRRAAVGRAS
jgi:D-alanine-D-alanine ligase